MGKAIVELENLSKHFGDVIAVDNVNLEIAEGEFVTLLGPSGCGKTTTMRMIAGLELPTSGLVSIEGQDVTYTPPERRPVNMVFQAYALFPHMTIAENIAFGPMIKKWPKDDIERSVQDMLKLVQLEGFGPRRTHQLSGGQAQRVALARALINRPKVLLLDEPLGALDLKLRKAMQLELRAIHQRLGMTFIYVTHDQEEAMVMSDRVVLMNNGHIVQVGTPTEIYNQPNSEFASRFIGEANLLNGEIKAVSPDQVQVELNGLTLFTPLKGELSVGQRVIISIRPERISLFAREEDVPKTWQNILRGTVESAIFLGPTARYHLKLAGDQILIVDQPASNGQVGYQVNDQLYVGWEVTSNIILPA
ncbi:MAG: ABC transporter ATP-binding protein [Chloroflexi bacterium]|nr:ABC transporter ATP-binding protein [Chloroflexota bacterium]